MNDGWINGDEQRKVEARARSNGMTEYMLDNISYFRAVHVCSLLVSHVVCSIMHI